MPRWQIDPARLEGEALQRWYVRTTDEIQAERDAAAARDHAEFFGRVSPGIRASKLSYAPGDPAYDDWALDYGLADGSGGGEFIEIGSKTRKHRRDWERREGRPWPTTEDGSNFHAHHKEPKADGGSDTLDNIEPKHPVPHRQEHMEKGDFKRWGSRSQQGRAGAPPPKPRGPTVRGLGVLGLLPNVVGLLTGSIRTDTFDNFIHDMFGLPSQEDLRREYEEHQRMLNPDWKPGDPMRV